jgi:hypothetical protein
MGRDCTRSWSIGDLVIESLTIELEIGDCRLMIGASARVAPRDRGPQSSIRQSQIVNSIVNEQINKSSITITPSL